MDHPIVSHLVRRRAGDSHGRLVSPRSRRTDWHGDCLCCHDPDGLHVHTGRGAECDGDEYLRDRRRGGECCGVVDVTVGYASGVAERFDGDCRDRSGGRGTGGSRLAGR